jgi:signal transduction histidine kinase
MKERVKIVNGTFDISSSEKGTRIEVEIPIK